MASKLLVIRLIATHFSRFSTKEELMDKWTWRMRVATFFHRIGYWFFPEEGQDIFVRDADGKEIFDIAFCGGWVITGPSEPYTLHSRTYADDDDLEGTVEDL